MTKKKRLLIFALLSMVLMVSTLIGCGNETATDSSSVEEENQDLNDGIYEGIGQGYGGELKLEVSVENNEIKDMEIISHRETSPVFTRTLPIAKQRILEAQSPIVDNVSGATYSSYAIKSAVGEAMKKAGKDFGEIRIDTQGPEVQSKELENETTQLVIVGAGPAGISSAIEAAESGVEDVILLEKLDILSGNGKFDMLIFDLINSKVQREDGLEFTVEDFIKSKEGKVMDSPERIEAWAKGAYELDEWFRDMGINLNYYYDEKTHMAEEDEYAGEHIHDKLEEKIKELDIDVRTGNKGTDLIIEDGKATGVKVQCKEGTYDIYADAVVIATGGFSNNKELLAKYKPGVENLMTSNQMGTTGDFIPVFEKYNFKIANMDDMKIFNPAMVKNRELTGARGDGFLFVNEEGDRFIAENEKDELKLGLEILRQPNKKVFYIYDQPLAESFYRLEKHNKLDYHIKADTLEELAEKLEINSENLLDTVEMYNKAVAGEIEDSFRDEPCERPFAAEGPYYGVQIQSAIHMTKGGVVANEKTQVLDTNNQVIEGLYAAGEVTATSGIFKEAFIFGRISGQEAAKYIVDK
ncbi:FAD-binding protein [Clostridiisalibacter paucivorans]|uniref:FAD-binding protein n=1 Tax=Clostridiisalibacter paucivorans TaxID=408753 RepID=UPI000554F01D|nr:FAD-binding protein [Clostridiisalibacter paucivorans]